MIVVYVLIYSDVNYIEFNVYLISNVMLVVYY